VRSEFRHAVDVEARERPAKPLALAEDGEPGEAGLECLERQPLEQLALAVERPAPLLVVVGEVVLGAE
jgi:hypothetical protein